MSRYCGVKCLLKPPIIEEATLPFTELGDLGTIIKKCITDFHSRFLNRDFLLEDFAMPNRSFYFILLGFLLCFSPVQAGRLSDFEDNVGSDDSDEDGDSFLVALLKGLFSSDDDDEEDHYTVQPSRYQSTPPDKPPYSTDDSLQSMNASYSVMDSLMREPDGNAILPDFELRGAMHRIEDELSAIGMGVDIAYGGIFAKFQFQNYSETADSSSMALIHPALGLRYPFTRHFRMDFSGGPSYLLGENIHKGWHVGLSARLYPIPYGGFLGEYRPHIFGSSIVHESKAALEAHIKYVGVRTGVHRLSVNDEVLLGYFIELVIYK